ncbi:CbtA family protein [Streptomyces albidoflavus]
MAAIAFCAALGWIGRSGPRATAAFVALGGLIAVYVVPFLKHPANPPAVGDGDTSGNAPRSSSCWCCSACCSRSAPSSSAAGSPPRLGNWNAAVAAGAAFLLAVTLAYVFLPSYNEVGPDFPGQLLWQFRLATLAVQAVPRTVFGLVFGALAERLLTPGSARPRPAETVAA